jgi:hypothetical protein
LIAGFVYTAHSDGKGTNLFLFPLFFGSSFLTVSDLSSIFQFPGNCAARWLAAMFMEFT